MERKSSKFFFDVFNSPIFEIIFHSIILDSEVYSLICNRSLEKIFNFMEAVHILLNTSSLQSNTNFPKRLGEVMCEVTKKTLNLKGLLHLINILKIPADIVNSIIV
jgi:hypothetical protein